MIGLDARALRLVAERHPDADPASLWEAMTEAERDDYRNEVEDDFDSRSPGSARQ